MLEAMGPANTAFLIGVCIPVSNFARPSLPPPPPIRVECVLFPSVARSVPFEARPTWSRMLALVSTPCDPAHTRDPWHHAAECLTDSKIRTLTELKKTLTKKGYVILLPIALPFYLLPAGALCGLPFCGYRALPARPYGKSADDGRLLVEIFTALFEYDPPPPPLFPRVQILLCHQRHRLQLTHRYFSRPFLQWQPCNHRVHV